MSTIAYVWRNRHIHYVPADCHTGTWQEIDASDTGPNRFHGLVVAPVMRPIIPANSFTRSVSIALYHAPFLSHLLVGAPSTDGGLDFYHVRILPRGCLSRITKPPCADVALLGVFP